jgi:hypothetical protein
MNIYILFIMGKLKNELYIIFIALIFSIILGGMMANIDEKIPIIEPNMNWSIILENIIKYTTFIWNKSWKGVIDQPKINIEDENLELPWDEDVTHCEIMKDKNDDIYRRVSDKKKVTFYGLM